MRRAKPALFGLAPLSHPCRRYGRVHPPPPWVPLLCTASHGTAARPILLVGSTTYGTRMHGAPVLYPCDACNYREGCTLRAREMDGVGRTMDGIGPFLPLCNSLKKLMMDGVGRLGRLHFYFGEKDTPSRGVGTPPDFVPWNGLLRERGALEGGRAKLGRTTALERFHTIPRDAASACRSLPRGDLLVT